MKELHEEPQMIFFCTPHGAIVTGNALLSGLSGYLYVQNIIRAFAPLSQS